MNSTENLPSKLVLALRDLLSGKAYWYCRSPDGPFKISRWVGWPMSIYYITTRKPDKFIGSCGWVGISRETICELEALGLVDPFKVFMPITPKARLLLKHYTDKTCAPH